MPLLDDRSVNTPPYFSQDGPPPTDHDLANLLGSGMMDEKEIKRKFKVNRKRMKAIKEIVKGVENAGDVDLLQDAETIERLKKINRDA